VTQPVLAMAAPDVRTTPLRHMLWLAWVLSAVYLLMGGLVALINRLGHGSFHRLAASMDQFAGAFLQVLGLWRPLMLWLAQSDLERWQLHLVLISLSVLLIFAYALSLGLLLNAVRAVWMRLGAR
jgi:hypothetical protein